MKDDDCEKLKALAIIISENLTYDPEAIRKVKEKMPELTDSEILDWINCAKRLLFKEEYLTKEIKEELKLWDSID